MRRFGQAARVVLAPVPERPRRVAADLPADVRSQKTRSSCSGLGSSSTTENAASVAASEARRRSAATGRRSGYVSQSGATTSDANFVQPESAHERAAADRRRDEPEAPDEEARHQRVVRVRARRVLRERIRGPREREHGARAAAPPKRRPTSHSPSMQRRSNAIDVKCAAGSESHLPLQPKSEVARGGTTRTRPGRTCRPAGSPTRSGRSSGCARGSRPRRRRGRTPSGRPRSGKFPHGAWPCTMRSAPMTPE